jgi:hypothetical protein
LSQKRLVGDSVMKVFVSWSGDLSHRVAIGFRDWLPSVIQSVKPYVSSEDIYKGSRWNAEVAKELATTNYGIICLTQDNLDSRWLNFEAGALSKTLGSSSVSPFLFDLKLSALEGPLAQFQSVVNDEDDILKMMNSLNNAEEDSLQLKPDALKKSFKVWWPDLKASLEAIAKTKPKVSVPESHTRNTSDILEELLALAREQQRFSISKQDVHRLIQNLRTEILEDITTPGSVGNVSQFPSGWTSILKQRLIDPDKDAGVFFKFVNAYVAQDLLNKDLLGQAEVHEKHDDKKPDESGGPSAGKEKK